MCCERATFFTCNCSYAVGWLQIFFCNDGLVWFKKKHLSGYRDSHGRLTCNMGCPILLRQKFYVKTAHTLHISTPPLAAINITKAKCRVHRMWIACGYLAKLTDCVPNRMASWPKICYLFGTIDTFWSDRAWTQSQVIPLILCSTQSIQIGNGQPWKMNTSWIGTSAGYYNSLLISLFMMYSFSFFRFSFSVCCFSLLIICNLQIILKIITTNFPRKYHFSNLIWKMWTRS